MEETATTLGLMAPPPPLFDQTNVRKPEYWQFAKLIAPSTELPPTKKHWTADDAIGIWCLRCAKSLVFQKGSSQSIRYHMETKHREELEAFRELGKNASSSSPVTRIKKRKLSGDSSAIDADANGDEDEEESGAIGTRGGPLLSSTVTPPSGTTTASTEWTWTRNLARMGGFWGNAHWYDVQIERRMPLVKPLVEELIAALPPCDNKHVLDLCAGSGRATEALVCAYPTAFVTLVDASVDRLALARQRLRGRGHHLADEQFITAFVTPSTLAGASPLPVDVVMGCLAIHVLAENPAHYAQPIAHGTTPSPPAIVDPQAAKETLYEQLFRGVWALLKPGGHFLFGDHVGQLPLFTQLQILARVGFVDVDCSWRKADFFVAGARKPHSFNL